MPGGYVRFLIDSNIFIPLEPTRLTDVEAGTPLATEFARLVTEAGHQLCVHPSTLEDIRRDQEETRRTLREIQFTKYPALTEPPRPSLRMEEILGAVARETNDWVDHQLLAALDANAVDLLVTEDQSLTRKAARIGLEQRVYTIPEAISFVRDLFDLAPPPPPAVEQIIAHNLDETDPIFESLRSDYDGFDDWLTKCKLEHREARVVRGEGSEYAGICIIKREETGEFGLKGKVLKLCTFKISERHNGFRFGELLLKDIFEYASINKFEMIYVTVFERHGHLMALLGNFGFQPIAFKTAHGETVLVKRLSFTNQELASLDPLEFNIRFGPSAIRLVGVPTFLIPIMPEFHRLLFPDAETQLTIFPGRHPCGNSIRKAYLCNAAIRRITPGSNLLFYHSEKKQMIMVLGVVEQTMVSSTPANIARYVGKRTVYSFKQIQELCNKEVLAILFRQSFLLPEPITLEELKKKKYISAAPQSIMQLPEEASEWLQSRLRR